MKHAFVHRATECVPHSVEMWLALSRLESYENAKVILNKAREKLPTEARIWIAACQLEESQGKTANLDKLMSKAVKRLRKSNVVIPRSTWIKYALEAEDAAAPETCGSIIRATLGIGVEEMDRMRTWVDDAGTCESSGHLAAARAILTFTLEKFPSEQWIWLKFVALERKHGTTEQLQEVLRKAVGNCPESEDMWLMAAEETGQNEDVKGARAIIQQAFTAGHNSEKMWLAAARLEWENREYDRARAMFAKARLKSSTARVWMKSALLERELKNYDKEEEFILEAIKKYPNFDKLHIMAGQVAEKRKVMLEISLKCSNLSFNWVFRT